MARYLERAEHTARVVQVHLNLMLDQATGSGDRRWGRVLASLSHPIPRDHPASTANIAEILIFDYDVHSSIVSCIMSARENARQVREQISTEMWEQLNRLFHEVRRVSFEEDRDAHPVEFLEAVRHGILTFHGMTDSSMNHGEGWQFIQIGRYLERAKSIATFLDVHYREFYGSTDRPPDATGHLEWIGLLRACVAFEAYVKTYTADLTPDRIAEFLLLNADFPHSVRFAVEMLQNALNSLPEATASRKGSSRVARLAGRLRAGLSFTQIDEIMSAGIHLHLENVQRQCSQIHSAAYQGYIDYPIDSALLA